MNRCGYFDLFSLKVICSIMIIYFVLDNLYNIKGFSLIWKNICKMELI